MKKVLFALCLSACAAAAPISENAEDFTAETAEGVSYQDASGSEVRRWVLTEEDRDGFTKLSVVERPVNDPTALQRLVFSGRFAPSEKDALAAKIAEQGSANAKGKQAQFDHVRDRGAVWDATRSWTREDEADFGAWIESAVGEDFFAGSGLPVDCADAAIVLRWIYAHDHSLPAGNTLAGSGALVGNWTASSAWASLPTNADWKKDERLKKALKYMQNQVFTHSLLRDLYPVELTRDYVAPGGVHLILRPVSGHTETIKHMAAPDAPDCTANGGCLVTVWGNEPSAEALFKTELAEFIPEPKGKGGFLRHRWPTKNGSKWSLTAANQMPGFSEQQFELATMEQMEFQQEIYTRLHILMSAYERASVQVQLLFGLLSQRTDLTAQGYVMCGFTHCAPSDKLYDDFSTPNRDARIQKASSQLLTLVNELTPEQLADLKQWGAWPVLSSEPLTYIDYMFNVGGILQKMSADPNADLYARWGITKASPESETQTLMWAWSSAWNTRINQIAQKAETARLDSGVRALSAQIRTRPLLVDQDQPIYTFELTCAWREEGQCMLSDYVFQTPEHPLLDRMTSAAKDSTARRLGLQ